MNKIILVTGGARSGKSHFSEKISQRIYSMKKNNKNIAYIATGEVMDEEFSKRISIHKERRSEIFDTIEESINIWKAVQDNIDQYNIFLIECITTWLGNIFYKYEEDDMEEYVLNEIENILKIIQPGKKINEDELNITCVNHGDVKDFINNLNGQDKLFIFVTNEIGLGIVPDNEISRKYRDILGRVNQKISSYADYVFFCISGNAVRIK